MSQNHSESLTLRPQFPRKVNALNDCIKHKKHSNNCLQDCLIFTFLIGKKQMYLNKILLNEPFVFQDLTDKKHYD